VTFDLHKKTFESELVDLIEISNFCFKNFFVQRIVKAGVVGRPNDVEPGLFAYTIQPVPGNGKYVYVSATYFEFLKNDCFRNFLFVLH